MIWSDSDLFTNMSTTICYKNMRNSLIVERQKNHYGYRKNGDCRRLGLSWGGGALSMMGSSWGWFADVPKKTKENKLNFWTNGMIILKICYLISKICLYTVCPRSSAPFYIVTYYTTLLLGHTVCCVNFLTGHNLMDTRHHRSWLRSC